MREFYDWNDVGFPPPIHSPVSALPRRMEMSGDGPETGTIMAVYSDNSVNHSAPLISSA